MQASSGTSKPVYFLFPGHGAEYVGMTEGLYRDFPVYRDHLNEGFRVARDVLGTDFKRVLFPAASDRQRAELELRKTAVIQPSLFLVQYAAGRTLIDLGVKPSGMLGHSVGEYAAACLAGVFSFETALRIVAKRGELVQSVPEGRMLAAAVTSSEAKDYLGPEVDLGSINGPRQCVFSGTPEGIEELSGKLKRDGVASRLLSSVRAFHSMLLDPILDEFSTFLEGVKFEKPVSSFVSCLHGKWANPSEVCQAEYWVKQLREPVRFLEGLGALEKENAVFLEVGPGGGLGSLVKSIAREDCLSCGMDEAESPGGLKAFETALKRLEGRGVPVTSKLMGDGPRELEPHEPFGPPRREDNTATSTGPERVVASCFSRVLGVSEIGRDASFLELGGNSLMAMQVIARLRNIYQCELGIREFFDEPTVRGVARSLAKDDIEQKKPVREGNAAGQGSKACPGTTPGNGVQAGEAESGAVDFGVFFFAGDENEVPDDRYGLVLDAARLADRVGISSVWLPERHFNKFGGLYPNPAVLGAAIASVTNQIQIRGGSVVAPLHHPVRIAEEWSVVDNLSKGRIGVAFGSGFHPNDFLLAPDSFAGRKEKMFASIESIRKLWKGEGFQGISGVGEDISVKLFPTPYSKELPVWLATSRSSTTFAEAGKMGANVLTALLRLSVDELAERIGVYRQAWRDAGHVEGKGKVTVMLHTYLGESDEDARATVEEPLRTYLRSHMEHTRVVSEEKAESGDDVSLSGGDEEALLDYALDRYLKGNSLVGTAESCLGMIRQLEEAGVDEVACLVDFGIGREDLMGSLERLGQLQH